MDLQVYCAVLRTPEGVEYDILRFGFFEKPMNTKYVLHSETAMGEKGKVTTLTQEVIMRLRNTSREAGQQEKYRVLQNFA